MGIFESAAQIIRRLPLPTISADDASGGEETSITNRSSLAPPPWKSAYSAHPSLLKKCLMPSAGIINQRLNEASWAGHCEVLLFSPLLSSLKVDLSGKGVPWCNNFSIWCADDLFDRNQRSLRFPSSIREMRIAEGEWPPELVSRQVLWSFVARFHPAQKWKYYKEPEFVAA